MAYCYFYTYIYRYIHMCTHLFLSFNGIVCPHCQISACALRSIRSNTFFMCIFFFLFFFWYLQTGCSLSIFLWLLFMMNVRCSSLCQSTYSKQNPHFSFLPSFFLDWPLFTILRIFFLFSVNIGLNMVYSLFVCLYIRKEI